MIYIMVNSTRRRNAVLLLVIGLFVSYSLFESSDVRGKKSASVDRRVGVLEVGKKSDKQIQQQHGVYQDKNVQQYVSGIGQKVLAKSDTRREDTPQKYKVTEFHFKVLDSEVPNAFALPGGYVYVSRGILS